jgi:dihydroneopterin aldolase/2-amino-4-hydroxy-6-hydroxymethyldihydropteridine diphosphokinase
LSTQDERSAVPLDRIRLTGVAATGYHGVFEHERREGQQFVADVVAYLDTRRAAARDDLTHTLDYGTLANQVAAVLAGEPADLIETVAERIAATVLSHTVVQGVDVTVHKPQAPIAVPFADVTVEIHRDRNKLPAAEPVLTHTPTGERTERPAPPRTAALPVVGGEPRSDAQPDLAKPGLAQPDLAQPGLAQPDAAPAVTASDPTPARPGEAPSAAVPSAPGPLAGSGGPADAGVAPVWAPIPGVSSAPEPAEPVVVGPAPVGALPTGVVPAVVSSAAAVPALPVPALPVPSLPVPVPPVPVPPVPVSPVGAPPVPAPPGQAQPVGAPSAPPAATPPTPPDAAAPAAAELRAPEVAAAAAPVPSPAGGVAASSTAAPDTGRPPGELVPVDVVDAELVTDALDEAPPAPVDVVIALGANLGPAQETLRTAVHDLASTPGLQIVQVSPLARTAPVGGPDQPDFLNAVVLARTTLAPRALLHVAQRIEQQHGRERHEHWGPRTLDVDLVVYGGVLAVTDDLELPHPRAHERAFVLQPWAEVDPHAVLPGLGGGPVAVLAATAPDRDGLRWMALDWLEAPSPTAPAPAGPPPSIPVPDPAAGPAAGAPSTSAGERPPAQGT